MKQWALSIQVALVFIGTVVGAGFASGREVMQFFTRFGVWAPYLIIVSTLFFVWIGAKVMLLAAELKAKSYEDLNKYLFGELTGRWVSHIMLIVLLGVNAVMLAGAGSLFSEHLNLNYQTGLIVTMFACFMLLRKGMNAILMINTFVVPLMIGFTVFLMFETLRQPFSGHWITRPSELSPWVAWLSPFLYAAFNLSMSQAVLVPLGSSIGNARILRRGAWIGGIGIGVLLLAGHLAMSARMPNIAEFDIPMGGIALEMGAWLHWIYVLLIFMEIFTTLVADIYGLTLQLHERTKYSPWIITIALLLLCFLAGQFGFGPLLSTLYPTFGLLSLGWLFLISRNHAESSPPPSNPPNPPASPSGLPEVPFR
ncbi:hypothetical protein D7Z26_13280 [Cohnella endophytica]|uniref:Membrane protein YkvI n=1 Tax=Cohnella endophytica TaxID=2419778 RepID=A0A494XUT6_9BACL|nr:hypothetical protein [Cohnella endophytica]RKP54328.1 hypothetical protein D7Z26_13280 [Cohnella endophytica]